MKDEQRREFLKKLAKGAIYAAPVIHSMTAPLEVAGQGSSTSHKTDHGNMGHGKGGASPASGPSLGGPSPGSQPPPGATPPSRQP